MWFCGLRFFGWFGLGLRIGCPKIIHLDWMYIGRVSAFTLGSPSRKKVVSVRLCIGSRHLPPQISWRFSSSSMPLCDQLRVYWKPGASLKSWKSSPFSPPSRLSSAVLGEVLRRWPATNRRLNIADYRNDWRGLGVRQLADQPWPSSSSYPFALGHAAACSVG